MMNNDINMTGLMMMSDFNAFSGFIEFSQSYSHFYQSYYDQAAGENGECQCLSEILDTEVL